ncbi:thiamine pyrophosphate-dependent enzyme [Pontibacter sp. G13]|uniref:alpha-ketoacid dehydrogenase subunit alpha/beta n=1 Tax=Pontibacter sp. G13 TaxID=3074898 RepID=UPI0028892011|nr:thiamine pyrophosphate-dependent enzyme [Pontibacter sp. G13]WNJ16429.1 thiamine pyrophosphate-dependent enzyme [Pontibacter sp. G13]
MQTTIQDSQHADTQVSAEVLRKAYRLMCTAGEMARLFEERKEITAKYVHATSRGHEAIQLALGLQLLPQDFVSPYYRDDSLLLGIGMEPYELMLQVFAKRDDPFSGGRTYYSHPSLRRDDMPKIPHQSSSTGMQAIPATGVAQGMQYREKQGLDSFNAEYLPPISVCSIGDGAMTEGEVSEALQMAALHQFPLLMFVQDNGWGISAEGKEMYAQNAAEFAQGFKGIETRTIDGTDFVQCYQTVKEVLDLMRKERRPFLIHAKVPLLNHHTSGVRKEWYRHDLEAHQTQDPFVRMHALMLAKGFKEDELKTIADHAREEVEADLQRAFEAEDPRPEDLYTYMFAPTPVEEEAGERTPEGAQEVVMVDAALHAVDTILKEYPEALLYGQDVGGELGGVFREAALLAKKYGDQRVFNTPIQEGYIIGSTVGMSAVGCKPIVEIQFADYIWPGVNQLYAEVSRSYYLSNGKWPVQSLIRVPIGAYGSGGPFHSSSVESAILTIRGVKVVYPSNAADMKGLMRAAFLDPNPVVMFEHKGLYWSKVPGSKGARSLEPSDDYVIPLGKARIHQHASQEAVENGESCLVITYGMGVHWATNASKSLGGRVEVLDLRTLEPLDWDAIVAGVEKHNKVLVLTEECEQNSFVESLAGRISSQCFTQLDAPVQIMGAESMPAIPLNSLLEATMLPNADKVQAKLTELLDW